jgi:hypothetical protein
MSRILKYPLPTQPGEFFINVAQGDFMSVQAQSNDAVLYIRSYAISNVRSVPCVCHYTGDEVSSVYQHYLGTAMLANGNYVLHYYSVFKL